MLFAVVGLGGMLRYVSQPVLSGFTAGLALLVAVNQLPALLGVQLERTSSAPELILALERKIPELNAATLAIALIAVVLLSYRVCLAKGVARLFGCGSVVARWIGQVSPLMVIAGGAVVVSVGDMNQGLGVKIVGEIPQRVREWGLPIVSIGSIAGVITAGFTVAFVIMIEAWSVETKLAEKRRKSPSSKPISSPWARPMLPPA